MSQIFPRGTLVQTVPGGGVATRRSGVVVSGTMRGQTSQISAVYSEVREVIEGAMRELENRQVRAFDEGGHSSRGGRAWAPLLPSTLAYKARSGWPTNILVRDGTLALSINAKTATKKTSRGFSYTLRITAGAYWGRFHATGFVHHKSGAFVPARPPVEFTSDDVGFVARNIRGALAKVGL